MNTPTIITAATIYGWPFSRFVIFHSVCVHKLINFSIQRADNVQFEVNNFEHPIYEHWYDILFSEQFKDVSSVEKSIFVHTELKPHLRFTKASEIDFQQTWNLISKSFRINAKEESFEIKTSYRILAILVWVTFLWAFLKRTSWNWKKNKKAFSCLIKFLTAQPPERLDFRYSYHTTSSVSLELKTPWIMKFVIINLHLDEAG